MNLQQNITIHFEHSYWSTASTKQWLCKVLQGGYSAANPCTMHRFSLELAGQECCGTSFTVRQRFSLGLGAGARGKYMFLSVHG